MIFHCETSDGETVQDLGTPGLSELSSLVEKLHSLDDSIYLHCWGGRGRSGAGKKGEIGFAF